MEIRDYIKEDTQFIARDGFMTREIAGEIVLVPVGDNAQDFNGLVNLNETSAFVWNALSHPLNIDEILNLLNQEYQIPNHIDVKKDIIDFLIYGIKNQLIFIVINNTGI